MSSTNEQAQKPEWLVRVPRGVGTAAGAGFLVDQRHVVTCAHVVAQHLGEPTGTAGSGPAPDNEVTVEFPFTDVRRVARVVGWQPIAEDQSGDAAVLRLAEPVTLTPAPLAFPARVRGHRFSVHGFPGGDIAARHAIGRLGGASGPAGEWIQLDADSAVGWAVEQGFSGAPVFDQDAGAVVGIVVMTDAHRSGHMLPMTALRSWWPGLLARRADASSWTAHWLPRARGSERQSDTGAWFFTGREAARQRVCDWLADPSQPALVITGGPGTGKSALLAHLLVSADPAWADAVPTGGPRPPVGTFDLAVHVSGLSCEDVARRVADAVGLDLTSPSELLAAMRHRRQTGHAPLVMMADAVEEAAGIEEARQIAILLRNLAGTGAVRILAGVRTAPAGTRRAEILGAFGRTIPHVPLESREFQRNEDVADYVRRRLTHDDVQGHYRGRPPRALWKISWAVARRARYNFLIAQLTALWLTEATTPPLDLADPEWDHTLPETVGEAMDEYLRHCGTDPDLVRRILTALAFARGNGLALDRTWLTISDALHPAHAHTPADLETVFHSAANYLIERTDDRHDLPAYRLYHHALDEHLRDHCTRYTPQANPQRAITRALTDAVPRRDHGRDWAAADAYTRTHLAGHAAEARRLDELLDDPGFLLYAEPGPLLTALPHARTEEGQLTAAAYRMSEHEHRHGQPIDRCRILALAAARLGARDLQHDLNTIQGELAGPDPLLGRVRFATGSKLPTAASATLTTAGGLIWALAVAELDGHPIALTCGNDDTMRIWDLIEQRSLGDIRTGHQHWPVAMAGAELDGRPVVVTCGDGAMRMWDLTERRALGEVLTGHADTPKAVAVTEVDGRPVAVTGGEYDGTVRIWDLAGQRGPGEPLTGNTVASRSPVPAWSSRAVGAVAVADLDGRRIAVTGGGDGTVRIWDLAGRRALGEPMIGHTDKVGAVAVAKLDGRLIAVTGGDDGMVRIWDLAGQYVVGEPMTGHPHGITTVAVAVLGGRPIAVTGSLGAVRIWDLAGQRALGELLTGDPHGAAAVATAEVDGRPVAVTASGDGTMRICELTEQPGLSKAPTGHAGTVWAVAVTEVDGRPVAVTGGDDGAVRMWDLTDHRALGRPLTGDTHGVTALVAAELDGRPIAVTGGGDGAVRMWDLTERRALGEPLAGQGGTVRALAVTELGGRPIAASGSLDGVVRIWDLVGQRELGRLSTGHALGFGAVAVAELDGRPIAVTAGYRDSVVGIWDLVGQRELGRLSTGHTPGVTAVAVAHLDGRPIAVTGGEEGTVRMWDLVEQRALGQPLAGHTSTVRAVTAADLDGCPIAVTGGNDNKVRTWDLGTGRCLDEIVLPGHVSSVTLGARGTLVVGFGFDIAVFDATPFNIPGIPKLSSPAPGPH